MPMAEIMLKVPKVLVSYIQPENTHDELVRNAMLVYPLIKNNRISHGRAAELLGIKKMELIELYGDMGIPYIDLSIDEIKEEVANYEEIFRASA